MTENTWPEDALEASTAHERAIREHMRATVFGEVLSDLMEERGLSVDPFAVAKLADEAGLENTMISSRMVDASVDAGNIAGLAEYLELSNEEIMELALALAFERRQEGVGA